MGSGDNRLGEGGMSALRAIYAGARDLGLDEDTRRDLFERVTGKRSLKAMNANEQQRVVEEMRRQGFSQSTGPRRKLTGKYAPKLQALWIAGWNLGIVRNKDDKALLAFVKRQTGLDHTQFLRHQDDAMKAIEALKKWLARDGGVNWSRVQDQTPVQCMDGYKIALAQFEKLYPHMGRGELSHAFWNAVLIIHGHSITAEAPLKAQFWIPIMNAFGNQIRALQS